MKKPYSDDWEIYSKDVLYSKKLNLYWTNTQVYDERSATHNGIIGAGAQLKNIIKQSEI